MAVKRLINGNWVTLAGAGQPGAAGPTGPTGPTGPAASASFFLWRKTATGGETSLSGLDDSDVPLSYAPGAEYVYLNGVKLVRALDYSASTGTAVSVTTALTAGDVVEVIAYPAIALANAQPLTSAQDSMILTLMGAL